MSMVFDTAACRNLDQAINAGMAAHQWVGRVCVQGSMSRALIRANTMAT